MGRSHYEFKGELGIGDYMFEKQGLKVPFQAMSDGYRAIVGWVIIFAQPRRMGKKSKIKDEYKRGETISWTGTA